MRCRSATRPNERGFERAQLVVVSARDDDQYQRGHAFVQEVARLRKDAEVFEDIFDWRSSKTSVRGGASLVGQVLGRELEI